MPGQIPQALSVLSDFLSQENLRLEKEIKEDDIRRTLEQASTKFSSIKPDDSMQDVRSLYFDSVRLASENEAEETIPFITQMFSESAKFIRDEKMLRQDERLAETVGDMTGINTEGLSGQGAGTLASLDAQTTNWVTTENKAGQSFMQAYKLRGGQFQPVDEQIMIKESTFKDRAYWNKRGSWGPAAPNLQKTTYETTDGQPVVFDPSRRGGGMLVFDTRTNQYRPIDPSEGIRTKESAPSVIRARDLKEAKTISDETQQYLVNATPDLAIQLQDAGYPLSTSDYKNLTSNNYHEEAFNKLLNERQKIAEFIDAHPDNEELANAWLNWAPRAQNHLDAQEQVVSFSSGDATSETTVNEIVKPETVAQVERILSAGTVGENGRYKEEYEKLSKLVREKMRMPIGVLLFHLQQGELSPFHEQQWEETLIEYQREQGKK